MHQLRRGAHRAVGHSRIAALGLWQRKDAVSACARRLLPLAAEVPQVGDLALVEREAVTLPLYHTLRFELANVGPAAIEVQR